MTSAMASFTRASLVPELLVSDLAVSLDFWVGIVGFQPRYERPGEGFAYLDRSGAQVMLEQRDEHQRQWVTGPLEVPYGRGVNFQIEVGDVDEMVDRATTAGHDIYMAVEEKWYRVGAVETGVRQAILIDPDGYLLRLSRSIGEREINMTTDNAS